MSRTIPHELPHRILSEFINRIEDLDSQLRAIEGIFETLRLLAEEFDMHKPTNKSSAYYAQVNAGAHYTLAAIMKSNCARTLFSDPYYGGNNA